MIRFLEYSKRTRFLLQLYGGTSYLSNFIVKYDENYNYFKSERPENPVIIVLDNDDGFKKIEGALKKVYKALSYPRTLGKKEFKKSDFIHVIHNLYIIVTPLDAGKDTAIEDLFDNAALSEKVSGKIFNPKNNRDNSKEYGKEIFAQQVVKAKKSTINFDGFKPLLNRMVEVIQHYDSIK